MANKIQIKRSNTAGKAPVAANLEGGELAINTNDGKLFLKKDDNTIVDILVGRVLTVSSNPTSYTINTDSYDKIIFSGQSNAISSITTSGTGYPNQTLWVSIIGSAGFTFSTAYFEPSTVALPTSSTTRIDVGFVFNGSKWRCVAVA